MSSSVGGSGPPEKPKRTEPEEGHSDDEQGRKRVRREAIPPSGHTGPIHEIEPIVVTQSTIWNVLEHPDDYFIEERDAVYAQDLSQLFLGSNPMVAARRMLHLDPRSFTAAIEALTNSSMKVTAFTCLSKAIIGEHIPGRDLRNQIVREVLAGQQTLHPDERKEVQARVMDWIVEQAENVESERHIASWIIDNINTMEQREDKIPFLRMVWGKLPAFFATLSNLDELPTQTEEEADNVLLPILIKSVGVMDEEEIREHLSRFDSSSRERIAIEMVMKPEWDDFLTERFLATFLGDDASLQGFIRYWRDDEERAGIIEALGLVLYRFPIPMRHEIGRALQPKMFHLFAGVVDSLRPAALEKDLPFILEGLPSEEWFPELVFLAIDGGKRCSPLLNGFIDMMRPELNFFGNALAEEPSEARLKFLMAASETPAFPLFFWDLATQVFQPLLEADPQNGKALDALAQTLYVLVGYADHMHINQRTFIANELIPFLRDLPESVRNAAIILSRQHLDDDLKVREDLIREEREEIDALISDQRQTINLTQWEIEQLQSVYECHPASWRIPQIEQYLAHQEGAVAQHYQTILTLLRRNPNADEQDEAILQELDRLQQKNEDNRIVLQNLEARRNLQEPAQAAKLAEMWDKDRETFLNKLEKAGDPNAPFNVSETLRVHKQRWTIYFEAWDEKIEVISLVTEPISNYELGELKLATYANVFMPDSPPLLVSNGYDNLKKELVARWEGEKGMEEAESQCRQLQRKTMEAQREAAIERALQREEATEEEEIITYLSAATGLRSGEIKRETGFTFDELKKVGLLTIQDLRALGIDQKPGDRERILAFLTQKREAGEVSLDPGGIRLIEWWNEQKRSLGVAGLAEYAEKMGWTDPTPFFELKEKKDDRP